MVELTKQVVFSDSLVEQNTQLAKVVEIGATLSPISSLPWMLLLSVNVENLFLPNVLVE